MRRPRARQRLALAVEQVHRLRRRQHDDARACARERDDGLHRHPNVVPAANVRLEQNVPPRVGGRARRRRVRRATLAARLPVPHHGAVLARVRRRHRRRGARRDRLWRRRFLLLLRQRRVLEGRFELRRRRYLLLLRRRRALEGRLELRRRRFLLLRRWRRALEGRLERLELRERLLGERLGNRLDRSLQRERALLERRLERLELRERLLGDRLGDRLDRALERERALLEGRFERLELGERLLGEPLGLRLEPPRDGLDGALDRGRTGERHLGRGEHVALVKRLGDQPGLLPHLLGAIDHRDDAGRRAVHHVMPVRGLRKVRDGHRVRAIKGDSDGCEKKPAKDEHRRRGCRASARIGLRDSSRWHPGGGSRVGWRALSTQNLRREAACCAQLCRSRG